MIAGIKDR